MTNDDDLSSVLRPALLEPDVLERLTLALASGRLCVLRDAFIADFAESTHAALDASEGWELVEQYARPFMNYRHMMLFQNHFSAELHRCEAVFSSEPTKRLMCRLSGVDCLGPVDTPNVTLYRPGDYQFPHADAGAKRSVSFVWNLSKSWQREWGGHFFWCSPPTNLVPAFNTLLLFRVTSDSYHFVCPISPKAEAKRLAISGWWSGEGALENHPTSELWYRGPLDPIGDGVYVV